MKMKAVFMAVCRRSLNSVLLSVQVFAFIARQTRTFARLSLLKYVQHVFIFNFKPLSDRIDINIHKYM